MLRSATIAVATAALSVTAASAQTLNLAAVNPATGGQAAPTSIVLGPGKYSASIIGVAGGGLYDAWNAATSNSQLYPTGTPAPAPNYYTEEFTISINGGTPIDVNGGAGSKYATAAAALAAYASTPYLFTLTAPATTLTFAIPDNFYADNTGGVSLRITAAVPEPATWAMMILGFGVAGYALRRRAKPAVRVSYAA